MEFKKLEFTLQTQLNIRLNKDIGMGIGYHSFLYDFPPFLRPPRHATGIQRNETRKETRDALGSLGGGLSLAGGNWSISPAGFIGGVFCEFLSGLSGECLSFSVSSLQLEIGFLVVWLEFKASRDGFSGTDNRFNRQETINHLFVFILLTECHKSSALSHL